MTAKQIQAQFSWKNYFRPTPVNIQRWVESIHGAIMFIATSTFITQKESGTTVFILMISGYVLEKLSKFFGQVADDYQHINIEIEGKNVTITKTTEVNETNNNQNSSN